MIMSWRAVGPRQTQQHRKSTSAKTPPSLLLLLCYGLLLLLFVTSRFNLTVPRRSQCDVTVIYCYLTTPCDRSTLLHRQISSISEPPDRMMIAFTLTRVQTSSSSPSNNSFLFA
ncbi:hypothetical protein PanWU01x14_182120 [Parasponia andersonii]|uniref:Uncharacterized protein n=1 Tax=Parasponia andersonii TaxID=3476 RepID=A0A2P5C5W6_PARAD|nr:hypothetical protein PanWU01x14_182120 [Parasponia andersonii]